MTRFGEIKVFGNFYKGLFRIWQNSDPTMTKNYAIGQIYIVVNGQILI